MRLSLHLRVAVMANKYIQLLVLVLCFAVYCRAQTPFTISFVITAPSTPEVRVQLPWYAGLTVTQAMVQAVVASNENFTFNVTYSSAQYGAFISSINGIENQATAYWLYSVDGEEAQVGVDFYVLEDGDAVEWTFTKTNMPLHQNFVPKTAQQNFNRNLPLQ